MGIAYTLARALGSLSTFALKRIFHRPAANFPGKLGVFIDPRLISELSERIGEGSIMVVGTNGKTTVTNLLADAIEASGKSVACNRTGANLDSGIATTLLHAPHADWGVFECDELWLANVAPQLQPDFILLLNLFRDQLDRAGEIEHVQESVLHALNACPNTTLIYNSDDPFCEAIARRSKNVAISFGIGEDLRLAQNAVSDSGMCQQCESMLVYEWRQYGQLGKYFCPSCGFKRTEPDYRSRDVATGKDGISFAVYRAVENPWSFHENAIEEELLGMLESKLSGTYMVYNLLAAFAGADCCGVEHRHFVEALDAYAPDNGRLQRYEFEEAHVLLNLAKNPTGFNQNLRIILETPGPKAIAFYINDKEADGHDVSWLWDVDFQELARDAEKMVFAGGIRRNDLQVRLKYAGVNAQLVDGATDFISKAYTAMPDANYFIIANYTALPLVKHELDQMQDGFDANRCFESVRAAEGRSSMDSERFVLPDDFDDVRAGSVDCEKLVIVHLYPELLNLYGDGGNVTILANRAQRRGIACDVVAIGQGDEFDLSGADIVFLGGGPDREQFLAAQYLKENEQALREYVEDDGVLLAICGGYQIIGRSWVMGEESVPGLGIIDAETKRAEGDSHNRLVGNIALSSDIALMPVVGYENHAGRTYLGEKAAPFGRVLNKHAFGNNDKSGEDGVLYRNVLGTYLHGPLLSKNPEVADWLIERALERRARKGNFDVPRMTALDDREEKSANEIVCNRVGVRL